jgi:hypothetical protein
MSVPMWERGSAPRVQSRARVLLGCLLTLLLAAAAHADEMARNETSFAKTKPGQVLNVSSHYKTVRAADVAPLDAVSTEAAPAERAMTAQPIGANLEAGGAMQAQPVSARAEDDVLPQKLAAAPRFAKADDEAGRAPPSVAASQREAGVAIYDIEKGKVFLPNGETLEAHSGIGAMRDNPAFVHRRNRGPTPPHIYDLSLRERRFLGVEAIRLTPLGGDDAVFGRDGFLAHTYMLGRKGDSNGCVVFKEYQRFLAAFKKGQVKRLVVVPRLKEAPPSFLTAMVAAKNG